MNVNGIICETLHPNNVFTKLYRNNYTEEERNMIIIEMNDSLEKKDLVKYKRVLTKIA